MVEHGAVAAADLELLKVTDDLDEAVRHIEQHAVVPFGLKRVIKPAWWLGEHAPRRFRVPDVDASTASAGWR